MKYLSPLLLIILFSCNSKEPNFNRISAYKFYASQLGVQTGAELGIDFSNNDYCIGSVLDKDNNLYCAGYTGGNLGETIGGPGTADAMIMKFDPNGKLLWITQMGSATTDTLHGGNNNGSERFYSIALDQQGNIYVGGNSNGDMGGPNNGPGTNDATVAKFNPQGKFQWLTQFGGLFNESCDRLIISPDNHLICSGITSSELDVGEGAGIAGALDVFLTKLTLSGDIVWKKQLGIKTATDMNLNNPTTATLRNESVGNIHFDKQGNLLLMGSTTGSLADINANENITRDIFAWKVNSQGNSLLVKQFGTLTSSFQTSGGEICYDFIIDEDNNIYATGSTTSNIGEAHGGMGDVFMIKFDASFNVIWKKQLGVQTKAKGYDNSNKDLCNSIVLSRELAYCAGITTGSQSDLNIGIDGSGIATLDVTLYAFDRKNGSLKTIFQLGKNNIPAGGTTDDSETGPILNVDSKNRLYVTGYTFGHLFETNANTSNLDIFLFQLDENWKFEH